MTENPNITEARRLYKTLMGDQLPQGTSVDAAVVDLARLLVRGNADFSVFAPAGSDDTAEEVRARFNVSVAKLRALEEQQLQAARREHEAAMPGYLARIQALYTQLGDIASAGDSGPLNAELQGALEQARLGGISTRVRDLNAALTKYGLADSIATLAMGDPDERLHSVISARLIAMHEAARTAKRNEMRKHFRPRTSDTEAGATQQRSI